MQDNRLELYKKEFKRLSNEILHNWNPFLFIEKAKKINLTVKITFEIQKIKNTVLNQNTTC